MPLMIQQAQVLESASEGGTGPMQQTEEARGKCGTEFFTIGYSGRSLESFLAILTEAGIATLVDVRHFPGSRFRPEFSKRNLTSALEAQGIHYAHRRELGIPSKVRREHGHPHQSEDLWAWYADEVLSNELDDLSWFPNGAQGPTALLCVESDPANCHRQRLGVALDEMGFAYQGDL